MPGNRLHLVRPAGPRHQLGQGLRVIDNERQRPRVERILERFGHIEPVEAIHCRDVT